MWSRDSQLQDPPGILLHLRFYPRQLLYVFFKNPLFLALHLHIKTWEEIIYTYTESPLERKTPNISANSLRVLVKNQDISQTEYESGILVVI